MTTFIYVGGTRGDFRAGARYVRVDLVPRDHAKVVHLACGGGWVEYNPHIPCCGSDPALTWGMDAPCGGYASYGVCPYCSRIVWFSPSFDEQDG